MFTMRFHNTPLLYHIFAVVGLLFSVQIGDVRGQSQFIFEVQLHSYSNCRSIDSTLTVCRLRVDQGCRNTFMFCASAVNDSCTTPQYSFRLDTDTDLVVFNTTVDDFPNPLNFSTSIASGPWPGGFLLNITIANRDKDSVLVDQYIINEAVTQQPEFTSPEMYNGTYDVATITLSYRLTCTTNYYGPNCERFCVDTDDASGHFTCDPTTGEPVCLPGFTDPSTNCVTVDEDFTTTTPPVETTMPPTGSVPCPTLPCLNGVCVREIGRQSVCQCQSGYEGVRCGQMVSTDTVTVIGAVVGGVGGVILLMGVVIAIPIIAVCVRKTKGGGGIQSVSSDPVEVLEMKKNEV